jgi:hypothetical protein
VFHIISNIFSLIFNKVLISLHNWLDSTHTNCHVATRGVFNFLYKETMDLIIFVIHRILYVDISLYNIIKFFKNIKLHIKLKKSSVLQTSGYRKLLYSPNTIVAGPDDYNNLTACVRLIWRPMIVAGPITSGPWDMQQLLRRLCSCYFTLKIYIIC